MAMNEVPPPPEGALPPAPPPRPTAPPPPSRSTSLGTQLNEIQALGRRNLGRAWASIQRWPRKWQLALIAGLVFVLAASVVVAIVVGTRQPGSSSGSPTLCSTVRGAMASTTYSDGYWQQMQVVAPVPGDRGYSVAEKAITAYTNWGDSVGDPNLEPLARDEFLRQGSVYLGAEC